MVIFAVTIHTLIVRFKKKISIFLQASDYMTLHLSLESFCDLIILLFVSVLNSLKANCSYALTKCNFTIYRK